MYNATSMKQAAPRLELVRRAAGLAALAALTLTACAADTEPVDAATQDAAEEPDTATTTNDETATTDDETVETDPDAADEHPPAESVESGDALEAVTYEIPAGDIDGTMTVGFHHLRTDGNTMELLLTFTPEFDEHEAYTLWELHSQTHSLVEPALYDRENLKRYAVLRSGGNQESIWSTHQNATDLASGDTQAYWANYALPEDDVETMSVGLPSGPEFKEVEIEWGSQDSETAEGGD